MWKHSAVTLRSAMILQLVVGGACATNAGAPESEPSLDRALITMCERGSAEFGQNTPFPKYWDPKTFDSEESWFGSQLCALDESPLRAFPYEASVRLLWLRTFHPGVAVRVSESHDEWVFVAKMLDGAGGFAPGKLGLEIRRASSRADWKSILEEIDASRFWSLPTSKQDNSLDGSMWIIEAAVGGRYHVVARQSGDEIRSLGERLLRLSTLDTAPLY